MYTSAQDLAVSVSPDTVEAFRSIPLMMGTNLGSETFSSSSSSSFYWASVANAPNVLQPYWLIALPLDVPALTASLLL